MEAALAFGEVDVARSPGRRGGLALLSGVLVATLGLAGFAVWGLLQPGSSTRWRAGDVVIVERETGAKYVYVSGRLYPVANYASALLILGARPATVLVARRALAGVARGAPLGIPGAPDTVPKRGDLVPSRWHVCSRPDGLATVVLAGVTPDAGHPLGDLGLLAHVPDGTTYLIWHGRRARLREPDVVRASLVWAPPVPLAPGLVGALATAPDLGRIPIPGRGQPFAAVPGTRVGQVFVVDGRQHVVALASGLAPINGLQAALLIGDPATVELVRQKAATPLSAGEYAAAPKTTLSGEWANLPTDLPPIASPVAAACLAVPGDVMIGAAVPAGFEPTDTAAGHPDSAEAGVEVAVPAGRGAVIEAMPAPGAAAGDLFLVTEAGIRYPVPSAQVLTMLGLDGAAVTRLPAEVAALLPTGPALDPRAARASLGS